MPDQLVQSSKISKTPFVRVGFLAILAACTAALAASGMLHGAFAHFGVSKDASDYILGIGTGVLLAGALVSLLKATYRRDGAPENRIDEFQKRQRRMLIAITVLVVGFGAMAILHSLHREGEIDFSIEFALLAVGAAAAATFGVGFLRRRYRLAANDELVRALRARSVQLGYMLAMIGLSTAYLLCIFRPTLTIVALPAALLVGVVVPTVYFLVAERRANSDG